MNPQKVFPWLFALARIPMEEDQYKKIVNAYIVETTQPNNTGGVPDRFGIHQDKNIPLNRSNDMDDNGILAIHDVIKDAWWNKVYPCPIK
jgi:hypothetical protein